MNTNKSMKKEVKADFVHDDEKCKKDDIIKTAQILFYENGYAKTSVNRIQKEAGVSKGLIYYHFKNKDDLALAVLQDVLGQEFIEYSDLVSQVRTDKSKSIEIIDAYLHNIFSTSLQNINTMQLIFDLLLNLQSEEYKKQVEILYQGYINQIAELLTIMGNQNPDTNAKLILSILDGLSYMNYTLGKSLSEKEVDHIISVMHCIINLEEK